MGLLSLLLGGISSGIGSQQPTITNTNTTATGSIAGTTAGSTTPTYSGAQSQLQGQLLPGLAQLLGGGVGGATGTATTAFSDALPTATAALQPELEGGTDAINKATAGSIAQLNQTEGARGFGNSGQSVQNAQQVELNRVGQVGQLNNQVDQQATGLASGLEAQGDQNYYSSLSDALNAAFTNPGTTATGSTSNAYDNASVTQQNQHGTTAGGLLGGLGTFFTGASQAGAGLAGDLGGGG